MTKKFSQLFQEDFDKYCLEMGLFSSPDIEKLVQEVLEIINKKVQKYELTAFEKLPKAIITLTNPLSLKELQKLRKCLKSLVMRTLLKYLTIDNFGSNRNIQ